MPGAGLISGIRQTDTQEWGGRPDTKAAGHRGSGQTGREMRSPTLERAVQRQLEAAGCVAADEEAEEMVGRAADRSVLEAWVERRRQGEPLAWIVGAVTFCGLDVAIGAGVYVPRTQSEELARRAGRLLPAGGRAADLCCGSGAVARYLLSAVRGAEVVGADIDPRAAGWARRNGVPAVACDLGAALQPGAFDVVTVVAPYVPTGSIRFLPADVQRFEPRRALDGGPDGLDVLRRVVATAARLLRPHGWLVAEVGGEQDRELVPTLEQAGFGPIEVWHDDEGDLRGLAAPRAVPGGTSRRRGPSVGALASGWTAPGWTALVRNK